MAKTTIEWTEATWNPATGCTEVSPGCKNCYAKPLSFRLQKMNKEKYKNGFDYTEHANEIDKPLHWKKPRMIFVNSMSDLFHENATNQFISLVFDTMMMAKQHTFQVLTKRPQRMKHFVDRYISVRGGLEKIPEHIWLGTSVESREYESRIWMLKQVNCRIKFVSFEPLLDHIFPDLAGIDWAIVGGESGPNHRRVSETWIKNIRTACTLYGTAFFFKQWGGRWPKENGNLLDGKKYQEFPNVRK